MRYIVDSKEKIIYLAPQCSSSSYFYKKSQEIEHFTEYTLTPEFLLTQDISDHIVIMIVRDPYIRFFSWYNRFNYTRWAGKSNIPVTHILEKFIKTANDDTHTMPLKLLYERACSLMHLFRAKEHKFLNINDLWIWFDEMPHVPSFIRVKDHTIRLDDHLEQLRDHFEPDYEWLENLNYVYNFTNTKIKRPKYYKYEYAQDLFNSKQGKHYPVTFRLH